MITAIRQKVTIGRGGVVSVRSRDLKAGSTAEVIVLVEDEDQQKNVPANLLNSDPIKALRGSGKGQNLTAKLLEERRKDREREDNRGSFRYPKRSDSVAQRPGIRCAHRTS